MKKKYWDARHNCYAYIIGDKGQIQRFSDDGEPQGTAGKPILDIIAATGLVNCLIIVTRYFGGVLLGTGGLGYAAILLGGVIEYLISSLLYRKQLSEIAMSGLSKSMK